MKYTRVESLVYFLTCDHDVIKIGPKFLDQKGNVLCVIQTVLRSTLGVYDIRPPDSYIHVVSCLLPSLFSLF